MVAPKEKIVDYRTFVSGIRPEMMKEAEPFEAVQKVSLPAGQPVLSRRAHLESTTSRLNEIAFMLTFTSGGTLLPQLPELFLVVVVHFMNLYDYRNRSHNHHLGGAYG